MAKWKRDVIYGVVLILLCILGIIETQDVAITGNPIWITRADVYVWLWLGVLAILSVIMIIKAISKKDETPCQPIWCREGVFTVIVMGIYLLTMNVIGFTISTFLFEAVLIIAYSWKMGKIKGDKKTKIKTIIGYLVVALVATIVTEVLFTKALNVRLPSGKLF